MKISILSVFPDLYTSFLSTSLVSRAQDKGLVTFDTTSFFSFVKPGERIDTPTFGHGAGMVIKPEVVERAIEEKTKQHGKAYKIFFSPHGKKLNQKRLQSIAKKVQEYGHCMLVPARYEGMDARVEEHYADEILSVGDFVLMGGDLPAMMFLEGFLRLIPGVVGKQESVERDSFYGSFVDHPEYGGLATWKDKKVPDVVRSGNHALLEQWRLDCAAKRTVFNHFDWLRSSGLKKEEKKIAQRHLPSHYVALMHEDVHIGDHGAVGTTSVTSLDIHDIARSSRTYGMKNYFIVTPLIDQQRIVNTLLDFWNSDVGINYNQSRHEAVSRVNVVDTIDQVIEKITKKEGKKPLLVATSARAMGGVPLISYSDQERVWAENRPVLFIFGTGRGLTKEFLGRCDYLLRPLHGFSDFNHLSVRSAAAIILDRWMGINEKT